MAQHLVGTKTVSIFNNEHFIQHVLLHLPHRNIETLRHLNHQDLPQYLQWYVAAGHHYPDVWSNDENVTTLLIRQGHRDYYVVTVLGHITSLCNLFYLLQIQVINGQQSHSPEIPDSNQLTLDEFQLAAIRHIDTAISIRKQYYHNQRRCTSQELFSQSDSDSDSEMECDNDSDEELFMVESEETSRDFPSTMQGFNTDINWQRPILLMGKPGSGKSQAICHTIVKHVAKQQNILVAAHKLDFLLVVFERHYPMKSLVTQYILSSTYL